MNVLTALAAIGLTLGIVGISGVALWWPEQSVEVAPRCQDCNGPMWGMKCRNVFCPGMKEKNSAAKESHARRDPA
jgi:hypothetical protein